MKNTIFTILFILVFGGLCHSQSLSQYIIASSGVTLNGTSNTLNFTMGEPVIGNIDNGESLGQGFWLGAIEGVVLSNEDFNSSIETSFYPNPVKDFLNISFTDMEGQNIELVLYDILGREVYKKQMTGIANTEVINLSSLNSGTYLLSIVLQSNNTSKTYKIIKQ